MLRWEENPGATEPLLALVEPYCKGFVVGNDDSVILLARPEATRGVPELSSFPVQFVCKLEFVLVSLVGVCEGAEIPSLGMARYISRTRPRYNRMSAEDDTRTFLSESRLS